MQSDVTKDFTKQISNISDSYAELTKDCIEQGTHIFQIGRYIDTARSDMARGFSEITQQDWLRVFEIDHFILMWRVYNNAMDFERLKVTQLNNPESCKLGKWIASLIPASREVLNFPHLSAPISMSTNGRQNHGKQKTTAIRNLRLNISKILTTHSTNTKKRSKICRNC